MTSQRSRGVQLAAIVYTMLLFVLAFQCQIPVTLACAPLGNRCGPAHWCCDFTDTAKPMYCSFSLRCEESKLSGYPAQLRGFLLQAGDD
ncbi:hypothetical protein CBR_g50766 [Chara braunii]|uniref:Granulins domain-containing protein n=1 Tax=Chara braunii TaxID=69332 RepID=A0A388K5U6_CHABU|nr:hypothetical protein CBR_g50766 [Chara braunii]|eukprot:GBG65405.1 hypothetical protein CBR_g50766 [Chara braunii]